MNEILTEVFIVAMYLATMMGMILFLAFVCRVGDMGIWLIGRLDQAIQDRHMMKLQEVRAEDYPHAYGPPGVAKSGAIGGPRTNRVS